MIPAPRRAPWPPWKENRRVALAVIGAAAALGAAVLWSRGGHRPDLAAAGRAAALLAWFALLMAIVRLPPRPRAPRQDGTAVLRASLPRRLAMPLVIGPALALVAWRVHADQPWPAGAILAALAVAVIAGLLVAALRGPREFLLRPDGLELRSRPGGGLLRWDRIRAVRVETYRRHAGLVLLGAEESPSVGVSAWLDGAPELAAELLAHAPASALADPAVHAALEALARELQPGR
jgi:hypothetical protein